MNSEDLKKIREALEVATREISFDTITAAREALRLFDAHVASLSQQEAEPWKSSGADYDRDIHANPDAAAWADFFLATFPNCGADRDLMIGWFANAMMAMCDHIKNKEQQEAEPVAWDKFPCYLINHCEGDVITEERLQHALAAMLRDPQYCPPKPAPLPQPVKLPAWTEQDALTVLQIDGDGSFGDHDVQEMLELLQHSSIIMENKVSAFRQPFASVPQGLEEFIYTHGNSAAQFGDARDVVPIDELTAWMAGHARVPVEPTQKMIDDGEFASTAFNSVEDIWRMMIAASQQEGV